jgi:hypothetical protein
MMSLIFSCIYEHRCNMWPSRLLISGTFGPDLCLCKYLLVHLIHIRPLYVVICCIISYTFLSNPLGPG